MGTIINANEMIKQERAAQDEADLPAYLLEEDRDLSQRPPVPPRQKLPSGPTLTAHLTPILSLNPKP